MTRVRSPPRMQADGRVWYEVSFTGNFMGLTLTEQAGPGRGVVVSRFVDRLEDGSRGPAEACGVISLGDALVRVNGEDVSRGRLQDISSRIKAAQRPVVLTFVQFVIQATPGMLARELEEDPAAFEAYLLAQRPVQQDAYSMFVFLADENLYRATNDPALRLGLCAHLFDVHLTHGGARPLPAAVVPQEERLDAQQLYGLVRSALLDEAPRDLFRDMAKLVRAALCRLAYVHYLRAASTARATSSGGGGGVSRPLTSEALGTEGGYLRASGTAPPPPPPPPQLSMATEDATLVVFGDRSRCNFFAAWMLQRGHHREVTLWMEIEFELKPRLKATTEVDGLKLRLGTLRDQYLALGSGGDSGGGGAGRGGGGEGRNSGNGAGGERLLLGVPSEVQQRVREWLDGIEGTVPEDGVDDTMRAELFRAMASAGGKEHMAPVLDSEGGDGGGETRRRLTVGEEGPGGIAGQMVQVLQPLQDHLKGYLVKHWMTPFLASTLGTYMHSFAVARERKKSVAVAAAAAVAASRADTGEDGNAGSGGQPPPPPPPPPLRPEPKAGYVPGTVRGVV